MTRPKNGKGLFYHRDSAGRGIEAPGQYVVWARKRASELNVKFDGTAEDINLMIRDGVSARGSLYLDYDVSGHLLSRPGLDALLERVKNDETVSHVFIFRRDRLARPTDSIDGTQLERKFTRAGVRIVYASNEVAPLMPRQRQSLSDEVLSVIEFRKAGDDRRELADKILRALTARAQKARSTGGRPPFGFERWLYTDSGEPVRRVPDGEKPRRDGHHIAWLPLPCDHPHMVIIRRILDALRTMPASRVAAMLNKEGVPPPDFGRTRTDKGVEHMTRGVWNATTITNIGRNKLLIAISSYGRRSMGDQLRFDLNGPRELTEADLLPGDRPKVVRNTTFVEAPCSAYGPIVDPTEFADLGKILDRRGGTQRGKPRSSTPELNPLGHRLFDLNCGSPLYRAGNFQYRCSLYMQSHGAYCNHNKLDGAMVTGFALHCLKSRLLVLDLQSRLRKRLVELATTTAPASAPAVDVNKLRADLKRVQADIETAEYNVTLAGPDLIPVMGKVLAKLKQKETDIQQQIEAAEVVPVADFDAEAEVEAAMQVLDRLEDVAKDANDLTAVGKAFDMVNLRIFFKFEKRQVKKRLLDKVSGGVVTFGDEPPPVQLYSGPTGRKALKEELAALSAANPVGDGPRPGVLVSGREGNSLGNVSRGDRI